MYNSQLNHNKYPQPLTRKGKSSWREGKQSNNGSMVLKMSNLMTKRNNGGKVSKRKNVQKPQSETGNGKNYH